ncbi:Rne/Rng family ribonuclease [Actinomycetes bacterium NPDC127524]
MKKVIVNMLSREKRYGVVEDGKLVKLEIFPPHQASLVGNVYTGKAVKILPGMEAAFIDFGGERNGFLHRDDLPSYQAAKRAGEAEGSISRYITQGEKLMVQVTRDETGLKGAKLTALIELSADSLVYMHGIDYVGVSKKFTDHQKQLHWRETASAWKKQHEGLIIRTSMENQTEEAFKHLLGSLRQKFQELTKRADSVKSPGLIHRHDTFLENVESELSSVEPGELAIDDFEGYKSIESWVKTQGSQWKLFYETGTKNIFSQHGIEAQAEKALKKMVWLDNGGSLIFEETEAFTVIDVNSGKNTGKGEKEQTIFETNMSAAKEIARQLRLRNIGGIILIDFINMKEHKNRALVAGAVKEAASRDERRVQVIGFTELGILQLTRKRTAPSLREKTQSPCPVCAGTGKVDSAETAAFRLERELFEHRKRDEEAVWIEANSAVSEALLGEREAHRDVLEGAIGKKLLFSITEGGQNHYHIKRFGSQKELQEAMYKSY